MPRMSLLCCLLLVPAAGAAAQIGSTRLHPETMNLGFEQRAGRTNQPAAWAGGNSRYLVTLDSTQHSSGSRSLRIEATTGDGDFASVMQSLPIQAVAGRTIRLSGAIRTDRIGSDGYAGLWMRVDGREGQLHLDNMSDRGPKGTTPWTRYSLEMVVDPCATAVFFGVLHVGDGTAWFDDLKLDVAEDSSEKSLVTCGTPEPPEWTHWTARHAIPISSRSSTDFSDLQFLGRLLEGKRVVQLGESGHGVGDFDLLKVRLIQYLHEELGYDVIAFESSLYECFQASRQVEHLSALSLMQHCIFGIWHTQEVLPLFEYIKRTASSDHPLILAGFDTQVSSRVGVTGRPEVFASLLSPVDTGVARQVRGLDQDLLSWVQGRSGSDTSRADTDLVNSFIARYRTLVRFFDTHESKLIVGAEYDTALVQVARQTAWSMTRLVQQYHPGPGSDGTAARDSGMAANLEFLLDVLYPGRKVITWGHNTHLRYANEKVTPGPVRRMGGWVAASRRSEMYTIGLYMHHGRAAWNNRGEYSIGAPWSGNVESILGSAPGSILFLDLSRQVPEPGNEWLFQPTYIRSWGTQSLKLVPTEQYDALVLIRSVQPPHYLPLAR